MKATNPLVQEIIARNDGLEYVDTATPMLGPDGRHRKELFLDDGLHMNAAGNSSGPTTPAVSSRRTVSLATGVCLGSNPEISRDIHYLTYRNMTIYL